MPTLVHFAFEARIGQTTSKRYADCMPIGMPTWGPAFLRKLGCMYLAVALGDNVLASAVGGYVCRGMPGGGDADMV